MRWRVAICCQAKVNTLSSSSLKSSADGGETAGKSKVNIYGLEREMFFLEGANDKAMKTELLFVGVAANGVQDFYRLRLLDGASDNRRRYITSRAYRSVAESKLIPTRAPILSEVPKTFCRSHGRGMKPVFIITLTPICS